MSPSKHDHIKPGADGLYDFSEIVAADMKDPAFAKEVFETHYRERDFKKAMRETLSYMDLNWVSKTLDIPIEEIVDFLSQREEPTTEELCRYMAFIYTGRDIDLDPRRGSEEKKQSPSGDAGAD